MSSMVYEHYTMLYKYGEQTRDYFGRFYSLLSLFFYINFGGVFNEQLFHSRLLDMRLVIANSALRASLAIYHLISNARSSNNY